MPDEDVISLTVVAEFAERDDEEVVSLAVVAGFEKLDESNKPPVVESASGRVVVAIKTGGVPGAAEEKVLNIGLE